MPRYVAPGVYVQELSRVAKPIEGVATNITGFVGMAEMGELHKPIRVTCWSQFAAHFGRYTEVQPYLAPAVFGFFANGGSCCFVVRVPNDSTDADYVGKDAGPGTSTGLQSLNYVDEVAIVCIPGITSLAVQRALIFHCENKRDRFCILDTAEDATLNTVQRQRVAVVSSRGYAGLYHPWIKVAVETVDAVSGEEIQLLKFVPPSGYVAGMFSRSDTERGVHKAPANEILLGALETKFAITKGEQDILNPQGINCIGVFGRRGIRVWGARTTASDVEWKYVSVRRLILFLEESIDKGTQWVVFEPNDERLWSKVRQLVAEFLFRVWRDGALMGRTPEEAFFIKCDRTTMTQNDLDNGRLICIVGVATVRPAEFQIFRIAKGPVSRF